MWTRRPIEERPVPTRNNVSFEQTSIASRLSPLQTGAAGRLTFTTM